MRVQRSDDRLNPALRRYRHLVIIVPGQKTKRTAALLLHGCTVAVRAERGATAAGSA